MRHCTDGFAEEDRSSGPVGCQRRRTSHPGPGGRRGRRGRVHHGPRRRRGLRITSCTNTSNPSVMLGAALLAKKAVEKGLSTKPWVKTNMAPGSQVVTDYYEKAGLWPYLEKLGYYLGGYGCTTCIGNTGPLPEEISKAINDNDLSVAAVLSGNRNFEGRISRRQDELPGLAAAGHRHGLAGTMDFDFESRAARHRHRRATTCSWRHLAVGAGDRRHHQAGDQPDMFRKSYADVFKG